MEITFQLPRDFTVPIFFTNQTPEKIAHALRLGADAVEQLYTNVSSIVREETHEQTVKEFQGKYQKEKLRLEELLKVKNEQLSQLELSNAEWQKNLQKRSEQLAAPILQAKDHEIESLRTQVRMIQEFGNKIDRLGETINKTSNNSSLKGKRGEIIVEEILKRTLDCEVQPRSKEAYSGDMHLIRGKGKHKYLVDSKDYGRAINQGEIDKLHRDLRQNADAVGAIMISLNSGITGHIRSGDLDIEFNENGKPILYIGHLLRKDEMDMFFISLRPFFEIMEKMLDQKGTITTGVKEESLQHRASLVSSIIRSHLKSMVEMRNTFTNNKKKIDSIYVEQMAMVHQLEAQIKGLLAISLGDEEQVRNASQDVDSPLPSFIFKKAMRADMDEKEQKFLVWLEKTFAFQESGELEVKIFTEKAGLGGFSEKETRAMRERIFTEEAWKSNARKIRGLCLLSTGSG